VTIDEELSLLDSNLRRLKIEYEIYFNNPSKRPPTDIEWKVLSLLRKFSDGGRMSFSQRYRYNEMAQRYAIYSDLWRKKGRIREEGYRRPQDALLSVQGVRESGAQPTHPQPAAVPVKAIVPEVAPAPQATPANTAESFSVQCSDATSERDKVETLFTALTNAKKKAGEPVPGNLDSFTSFVQKKTEQLRRQYACEAVEYTVELEGGHVRLKAKAKA
jgi:hypothetical protein